MTSVNNNLGTFSNELLQAASKSMGIHRMSAWSAREVRREAARRDNPRNKPAAVKSAKGFA